MTTVTLDTNVLDQAQVASLVSAARGLSIAFGYTTVSGRELEGSSIVPFGNRTPEVAVYDESRYDEAVYSGPVPEVWVLGESRLGEFVLGASSDPDLFESILLTISNGSFPPRGARDQLTDAQRRQLRDAMILHTHVFSGRDILVSNDKRAFLGRYKLRTLRTKLEALCGTRIMNADEFLAYCATLRRTPTREESFGPLKEGARRTDEDRSAPS